MYISRLLANTLDVAANGFPAILVTGPRQSGKTTFLRHQFGDRVAYVTFDDPLERDFARNDPEGFLSRFDDTPAILDEIQYVPDLLPHLKMRIDAAPEQLGQWLLTGSQQFELMHQLGETLAGRIAILELLPFCTPEFGFDSLEQTIWQGGYPIPAQYPERRDLWMRSYLSTYIERDVRQLQNITDLAAFERLLALAAANHSQTVNYASLAREVGISQPTVKAWLGVLQASYVVLHLPPYFQNFGKRIVKSPKLYFLDPALACTLTQQPDPAAALAGPLGGPLLEGWVIAETAKLFAATGRKPAIHFWRSHDGLEVDLIIQLEGRLQPVEIKLTATPTPRHLEPLNRFRTLAGENNTAPGLLVCRTRQPREMPGGNLALPWRDFPGWLSQRLNSD